MLRSVNFFARGMGVVIVAMAVCGATALSAAEPLSLLLVDGQNNHNWKATTPILKAAFEQTGRFRVTVATTPPGKAPATDWDAFRPDFSKHQVVVSNYNGELWPEPVRKSFEAYVSGGGGVVIVHAANNAFPEWPAFNEMIGLGWRGNSFGDRLSLNEKQELVRTPKGEGPGAGHGAQHEYVVVHRDREHPVLNGLPVEWKHAKDELYHGQRGPAAQLNLLATAFDDKSTGGTGVHEPMIWWIPYGKGKVFTSVLGHADYSMKCVGFQTTITRGAEWVATGAVTIPAPAMFPAPDAVSSVE